MGICLRDAGDILYDPKSRRDVCSLPHCRGSIPLGIHGLFTSIPSRRQLVHRYAQRHWALARYSDRSLPMCEYGRFHHIGQQSRIRQHPSYSIRDLCRHDAVRSLVNDLHREQGKPNARVCSDGTIVRWWSGDCSHAARYSKPKGFGCKSP